MNAVSPTAQILSSCMEHANLYPSLDLKRKFFLDLQNGDVFAFWCEGGSKSAAPRYVKVSHDSMISLTDDVHPLNADPQKDVLRISMVQENSPVYHQTRIPSDAYMRLIGRYAALTTESESGGKEKVGEKSQPTAA